MISSISVVLPLFLTAFIGFVIGRIGLLSEQTTRWINRIVYDVLFPCSFFISTYNSAGKITISLKFITMIFAVEAAMFMISFFIAKAVCSDRKRQGVLQQGMFRSNMVLFGTVIASSMLRPEDAAVFTISLMVILPLQNTGSAIGKELFGETADDVDTSSIVKNIITNTQVISIAAGLLAGNLGIVIPQVIIRTCSDLGSAASPMLLLTLGATLKLNRTFIHPKETAVGVIAKLLMLPALFFPATLWLNLTYPEAFVIVLLLAAPTAVSVLNVSMKADWDIDLANELILFTTLLSLFSLSFWMSVLQKFA